jgi:hypothetical protein
MLAALRPRLARLGTVALVALTIALGAAPAGAGPLGLNNGDTITSVEWDALMSTPGQGGAYDNPTGLFHTDGRVTAVNIQGPTTVLQSNVDFEFDLAFVSESLNFVNFPPTVFSNIVLGSAGNAVAGPDVIVRENGNTILFGDFTSLVVAAGDIDVLNGSSQIVAVGRITITGGDANLVNALGGAGVGQANILLTASIFGFSPDVTTLLADQVLFNSNFAVSLSGTLIPLSSAPFVPEPSTALLLGGGLIALIGVTRRARR